jgi:uncharacterized protein YndB with AHSA1/START domain
VNDTLTIRDGRNILRLERRFAHAPEKMWRAVIEPERLSRWYPATVTELQPHVGGSMALDYGGGWTTTAVVTAFDPPRLFAFTERALAEMPREGDGEIRIELRPDGDGCLMIFSQTFDDRPNAAGYAAGWHACFDALESALDGRPAGHANVSVERHEMYVKAFGLDRAEVARAAGGWTVTYIRHVPMRPVEAVWSVLTGSGDVAPGARPPDSLVPAGVETGAVAAVEQQALVAFDWLSDGAVAGRVRWALVRDPGGARIELTQTGPAGIEPRPERWRDHVEALIPRMIDWTG